MAKYCLNNLQVDVEELRFRLEDFFKVKTDIESNALTLSSNKFANPTGNHPEAKKYLQRVANGPKCALPAVHPITIRLFQNYSFLPFFEQHCNVVILCREIDAENYKIYGEIEDVDSAVTKISELNSLADKVAHEMQSECAKNAASQYEVNSTSSDDLLFVGYEENSAAFRNDSQSMAELEKLCSTFNINLSRLMNLPSLCLFIVLEYLKGLQVNMMNISVEEVEPECGRNSDCWIVEKPDNVNHGEITTQNQVKHDQDSQNQQQKKKTKKNKRKRNTSQDKIQKVAKNNTDENTNHVELENAIKKIDDLPEVNEDKNNGNDEGEDSCIITKVETNLRKLTSTTTAPIRDIPGLSNTATAAAAPLVIADQNEESSEFRPVFIDGSNVAFSHGLHKNFSHRGILLAVNYFLGLGCKKVYALIPRCRQPRNVLFDKLESEGHIVYTPSRYNPVTDCRETPYDDRIIIDHAVAADGVIVSNDQYRDLFNKDTKVDYFIINRLIPYTIIGDIFNVPKDPRGEHGPSLMNILRVVNENTPINQADSLFDRLIRIFPGKDTQIQRILIKHGNTKTIDELTLIILQQMEGNANARDNNSKLNHSKLLSSKKHKFNKSNFH